MRPEEGTKKVNKELDDLHNCIMKSCLIRIKEKTPVRTGRLQDSWIISDKNTISSDVEYASFVEFGTYKMAPVGMLRSTALEVNQIAEECGKRTLNK